MLQWLFLDMNSYFASVEQQFRPELRDRPVGVVPVDSDGSCVIAASYSAKRFGVRTGTRVTEAKRLCRDIELVLARPAFYIEVHHRLLRAFEEHAPIDTVYSIDEWAAKLIGDERRPQRAAEMGRAIKRTMAERVGRYLTCSIGVAPTRLLAKTACELHKPDGLTSLDTDDLPDRVAHLALDDLPGIGPGMVRRLYRHGIRDVTGLWNLTEHRAREVWGSVEGARWWRGFHGIDEPPITTHRHSMGHSNVLAPKFRSDAGAHGIIIRLLHKLAMRLRHHGYVAHGLTAHTKHESSMVWRDAIDLPGTQDTRELIQHFNRLWDRRAVMFREDPSGRPPPAGVAFQVGVTVTGLTPEAFTPRSLFEGDGKALRLSQTMDRLNRRWGGHTIYFGGMHSYRHKMDDKIAFGRVPDEAVTM